MAEENVIDKYDFGALSLEQQEQLRQFKIKTRIANAAYLRCHPEVDVLLGDFLRHVLKERPTDVRGFAEVYFSDQELPNKIKSMMDI